MPELRFFSAKNIQSISSNKPATPAIMVLSTVANKTSGMKKKLIFILMCKAMQGITEPECW